MPADLHRFSQLQSRYLEFVIVSIPYCGGHAMRKGQLGPNLPSSLKVSLRCRMARTPYKPFHPYKKVAEDALSRGIVNIDTIHTSSTGTDSRLAAIVRKQAARFTRHGRDRRQASRPRPPGCGEPKAGNDVPAGVEDSTRIQQSTHDEMLVSTIVPDGMPSSDAMPEQTSAMREVLPWPVGFFGGMWKKLIGDAPVPGVHIPTNSAVARAEQCGQRDEEVLARKRRREDEDDEGDTPVAVGNSNQEQRDNPRAQPEKPRERKRRRDMEPEKSTRTGEANFIDDLQQDGYVDEETGQTGDPKQGGHGEEAAYPEVGYSSSTDEPASNSRDPEQGGDGEEAADQEVGYSPSTDESMSDVEHAEEGADWEDTDWDNSDWDDSDWDDSDWEEESRNEFEDRSGEFRELSVAEGKGESEQAQVADIKGKNKTPKAPQRRPIYLIAIRPAGRVTLESKIRLNMREELGQIVKSAVADAIAKAFPNGMVRSLAPDSTAVSENSLPLAGHHLKKAKQLPRPRPSDHNAFKLALLMIVEQKSVRELRQKLLGLEGSKELPQPVSEKEIAAWDPGSGPCCTVDNFSVDLLGYARSEWNRSAAQVFAMEYVKHYKGENRMLEFVAEAWLTRVAGMKAQYRQLQQDKTIRKDRKALHRRRQRKQELYKRRLDTAYQYTKIKDRAVRVVQSLGLDGMSSDESDHEGHSGEATYYILDKDWRS
ncbi:hypothetical protein BKA83DRAFT_4120432 [Pisolithus microcarpus]|nr:hypothetical protein BKA83DRAFT_4120432 [Pisolithus microcarpus]